MMEKNNLVYVDYTDEIDISKIPWEDLKLLCKDYSLIDKTNNNEITE